MLFVSGTIYLFSSSTFLGGEFVVITAIQTTAYNLLQILLI